MQYTVIYAKSSIHIQSSVAGILYHNDRINFSYSVVFLDEKNELKNSSKQAEKIYHQELFIRQTVYINEVGQPPQKSTITALSTVVNLHKHHTLKDMEPIVSYLEEKLDTKVYQLAIHRDEGKLVHKHSKKELYSGKTFFLNPNDMKYYYDKDYFQEINLEMYFIVKNYHAHIEMMGIDSRGKSVKRNRLHKRFLQELQTYVADTLDMERGEHTPSYTQEQMKEILKLTGPKESYPSIYEWKRAFNRSAKSLNIFIEKKKRKDTKQFKEHGVIVQDLKEQIFKLQNNLETERYEYELLIEINEGLENENGSLKDDNFTLKDDISGFRQGLHDIKRSLDIYHGVEYEEEGIVFEKFEMEEVSRVVNNVDDLILKFNQESNIHKNNSQQLDKIDKTLNKQLDITNTDTISMFTSEKLEKFITLVFDFKGKTQEQIERLKKNNNMLKETMGSCTTLNIKNVAEFGLDNGAFAKIVSNRYLNIYKYFEEYLSGNYHSGNKQSFINDLQIAESELITAGYREFLNQEAEVKIYNSNSDILSEHKIIQRLDEDEENTLILKK